MLFRAHGNAIFLGSATLIYCFSGHHPPTCMYPLTQDLATGLCIVGIFLHEVHFLFYSIICMLNIRWNLKRCSAHNTFENSLKTTSKCCSFIYCKFVDLWKMFVCHRKVQTDAKILTAPQSAKFLVMFEGSWLVILYIYSCITQGISRFSICFFFHRHDVFTI